MNTLPPQPTPENNKLNKDVDPKVIESLAQWAFEVPRGDKAAKATREYHGLPADATDEEVNGVIAAKAAEATRPIVS